MVSISDKLPPAAAANATGLSLIGVDLTGQLVLLKRAVPNLSRVALVTDAPNPAEERIIAGNEKAARDLGISLWPAGISEPADVEPVFAKMVTDRVDGFALTLGPLLFYLRGRKGRSPFIPPVDRLLPFTPKWLSLSLKLPS
jgi:putative tryptophan/tyrosine transport system substrate-binding protein